MIPIKAAYSNNNENRQKNSILNTYDLLSKKGKTCHFSKSRYNEKLEMVFYLEEEFIVYEIYIQPKTNEFSGFFL